MRFVLLGCCAFAAVLGAQESAPPPDPRVGLEAGFRDAGEAARNLERVGGAPKPAGFFDPASPKGEPTPPESESEEKKKDKKRKKHKKKNTKESDESWSSFLNFANSDLAFSGARLFAGNFHGFNAYDIEHPEVPQLASSVVCPGGQGDVSVVGNLLFMSVEQTRGRLDCGIQGVSEPVSAERFRGIRIFDIRDVRMPKQVAAVQTCRGSHTHTVVTHPDEEGNLYIYGSGTSSVRSAEELEGCSDRAPEADPETALFSIDVIQVPVDEPEKARIVNRPRIFADRETGAAAGLWKGGDHGPGTQKTAETNQCHDITVFPELGLAAGACSGNGILLDISDPVNPVRLDEVVDKSFAYWHSATFNHDGTKVVFTDEWGGGLRPRCRASDPREWGANAVFDIVDRKLHFRSYYKLPAPQGETENCVAHNGSLVPVAGRDIMVQGWYQGGITVFDFTDSANPIEIAYFDRGPIDSSELMMGGYWAAYWYDGYIYASEIARGIDVFRLLPSDVLSENEIESASLVSAPTFNAQQQRKIEWPASPVVARAYLDQLTRSGAVSRERADAVSAALETGDRLAALSAELESASADATGVDAARLRKLGATLAGLAR